MRRVIRELAIGVGIILLLVAAAVTYEVSRMVIVRERLQALRPTDAKELPYVADKLHDYNRFVRIGAVVAVLNVGADESVIPYLIKALDDTHPQVRYYSVYALAHNAKLSHAAVPKLITKLDDPTLSTGAAYALGSIGPPEKEAIPKIIILLKQGQNTLYLIHALELFGGDAKAALPHLQTLTQDPDPEISKAATKAIQAITAPPAIPMP